MSQEKEKKFLNHLKMRSTKMNPVVSWIFKLITIKETKMILLEMMSQEVSQEQEAPSI